jgi:hypothetical protein
MSYIIKVNKPSKPRKAPAIGKTRQLAETRVFPKYVPGMTTLAYIHAYHTANAAVMLSMPTYTCQHDAT